MTSEELQAESNRLRAADAKFFAEAFTDPVTRELYKVPKALRTAAERICRSYGIRGVCDPMYIANVIAVEMGLGDGKSNFNEEAL